MSAGIFINGVRLGVANGRTYVLEKIIDIYTYGYQEAMKPELTEFMVEYDRLIFGYQYGDTTSGETVAKGGSGMSFMVIGKDSTSDKYRLMPSIFNMTGSGTKTKITWFIYRPTDAKNDVDKTPPFINVYNEGGQLTFSSKNPILTFREAVRIPHETLRQKAMVDRNKYYKIADVSPKGMIMLNTVCTYSPGIAVMPAITPSLTEFGVLHLGMSTDLSMGTYWGDFKVYNDTVFIANPPTEAEQRLVPRFKGKEGMQD